MGRRRTNIVEHGTNSLKIDLGSTPATLEAPSAARTKINHEKPADSWERNFSSRDISRGNEYRFHPRVENPFALNCEFRPRTSFSPSAIWSLLFDHQQSKHFSTFSEACLQIPNRVQNLALRKFLFVSTARSSYASNVPNPSLAYRVATSLSFSALRADTWDDIHETMHSFSTT